MTELKEIDVALAEILLDYVLGKKGTLTYKEVAEKLEQKLGKQINPHYSLSTPLGNVSKLCFQLGLPLISAIVIYSGTIMASVKYVFVWHRSIEKSFIHNFTRKIRRIIQTACTQ